MTKVVNLRKEDYDVYVGRGSIFGNKYSHIKGKQTLAECIVPTREEAIRRFKEDFLKKIEIDENFRNKVKALKGKRLGCFCKPEPCHADVIKDWVDSH